MDDGGVQATHHHPRTVGCISGPEIVCQEPGGNLGHPPAGQCHSNCLVSRTGGTYSMRLSDLAVEIWNWCICRNITIHAEHLPGLENVRADWESRHLTDSSDWMLHRDVFRQLESKEGHFSIGLFALRTNTQLPLYCSWRPDPNALAVDAFLITWRDQKPYLFPPFIIIPRCLNKLREEQVTTCVIAPVWPNQVFFPQLLAYVVDHPILLPPSLTLCWAQKGGTIPWRRGATCLWPLHLSLEILLFTGVIRTSYGDH